MVCFPFVMSPSASFLAPSSFSWRACNGFMSSFLISETKFVGYIYLESKVKDSSKCAFISLMSFLEVPPETYCILDIRTSTDDLMTTLNWDKLDKRWQKQLLLIVFKCLKHDAPSNLSSKFVYTSSVHSQNTRSQSSNTLLMPSFNIKPGRRTFN